MKTIQNLIDNWQLEGAASLLSVDDELLTQHNMDSNDYSFNIHRRVVDDSMDEKRDDLSNSESLYKYLEILIRRNTVETSELLLSLMQVLDLLILSDEILYDSIKSSGWKSKESLKPMAPLLREIRVSKETKQNISREMLEELPPNIPKIVGESAIVYLGLANFLGVDYWPSSRRAEFLKKSFISTNWQWICKSIKN